MKLPDYYNYGTIFAYSGLEGENSLKNDFVAMLMPEPVTIRFDAKQPVTLHLPAKSRYMTYVLSDALLGDDVAAVFADCNTVLGRCDAAPFITTDTDCALTGQDGVQVLQLNGFCYALLTEGDRFVFCREATQEAAVKAAKEKRNLDLDTLLKDKLRYFESKPACRRPDMEQLYYKCLSVQKVNVYSPQSGFSCRFTTPDRVPHHHVWLWDSMFHALAFSQYDPQMAKESILAVLQAQREDGFLPHMMKSRVEISSITQPQVVAWAALCVYRETGDKQFLAACADKIAAFLLWFLENRDLNQNGLLEWKTDFNNVRCRCDESGMDNSPRFDTRDTLDAIDANCFMVNDCRCLGEIYRILGNETKSEKFTRIADDMTQRINELLWDEDSGCYYDRGFEGGITGVMNCCSFLPLFAGVCSESQAARLVSLLQDETRFNTPLPVPSIVKGHPDYGADMWRGCVWLNFNYFIARGLRRYGYHELAKELVDKTLDCVNRWFKETGNVFEFYDAEDETVPWHLNRKGEQPKTPDYRVKYHAITDFNWSACFTMLMLQDQFFDQPQG